MLSKSYINAAMKNQLLLDYLKVGPFMYFSDPNHSTFMNLKKVKLTIFDCLLVCLFVSVDAFIARR